MAELIRKPRTKVDRRLVHAALLRLAAYPTTTSTGTVMRLVDEYAASQHTDRVYRHAEQVIAEGLLELNRATEKGKKIFLCLVLPGLDIRLQEKYVKNFFEDESQNYVKKFFKEAFPGLDQVTVLVDASRTSPECEECQDCPKCQVGPECPHGPECPICHETSVRDTSDTATFATDTRDTVTDATDTSGTGASVTAASAKGTLATEQSDKGTLATDATDTRDTREAVTPATDTRDTPADGAASECENGENGSHTPDAAPGLPLGEKPCTRCGAVKPLDAYSANRSRADGRASACRDCENERDRLRRAERRRLKEAQKRA